MKNSVARFWTFYLANKTMDRFCLFARSIIAILCLVKKCEISVSILRFPRSVPRSRVDGHHYCERSSVKRRLQKRQTSIFHFDHSTIVGREFLFQMSKDLRVRGIRLPSEMSSSLLLLHSYLLIRPTLSVRNDHMTAARLLTRVAKSISKFPKHIVQLLTKTVIECNKVGLQRSAFDYAALLMRPEYR